MYRTCATAILILFLAALPVLAEGGEEGDAEINLYLGAGFPDNYGEGDNALNPKTDLLYGARFGYWFTPAWSGEITTQFFESETDFEEMSEIPNGPELMLAAPGNLQSQLYELSNSSFGYTSLRFNILYNFLAGQTLRPYLTLGFGFEKTDAGSFIDDQGGSYNAGGGVRWLRNDSFGFRFDARWVSTRVGGTDFLTGRQDNLEASAGLMWLFGGRPPADTDGDGVPDRRDKCPDTPRGAVVDEDGCPKDSDGDGVFDGIDKCPDTPAGTPVDSKGCPLDSDGDGVHDGIDKCPDTPKGAIVDEVGCPKDSDGDGVWDGIDKCPDTPKGATVDKVGCPKDSDGDGVLDGIDKCPGTPKGAIVDKVGCPKDSDGDGVWDGIDKCPDTPEGAKVDEKGCQLFFQTERKSLVLKGVNFELNSDKLTDAAMESLDRVSESLKDWPEIKLTVAGHTDSSGSARYNMNLSQRRAESVRAYLIEKGVNGDNLTAKGYGETKPIADEATEDGRRTNRRVELEKQN